MKRGGNWVTIIFDISFEKKNWVEGGDFYLVRVVVPSPKIVINHAKTYEKLPYKGEPIRLARSFGTHRQTQRSFSTVWGYILKL